MTTEEKAKLLDSVDGYKTKYLETDKLMIFDKDYFMENPQKVLNLNPKGRLKLSKFERIVFEYQEGEQVPIKLLHQSIVDALYNKDITAEEMEKFITIIRDCKWLEETDYEELVGIATEEDEEEEEYGEDEDYHFPPFV